MHYFGGKQRIAKHLVEVIKEHSPHFDTIYEPFCGGCGMTTELAKVFDKVMASDYNKHVIDLYHFIQERGCEALPDTVTEEDYNNIKNGEIVDSIPVCFALIGCAFGGKYKGGYARSGTRNYAKNCKNSLTKKFTTMENVEFLHSSFESVFDSLSIGDVVYCDPPYRNTTDGYCSNEFDSDKFWNLCFELQAKGVTIFISEYTAPEGVPVIWEKQVKTDMHGKGRNDGRIEKLFLLSPKNKI